MSLLSKSEVQFLRGQKQVSKSYEYKLKSIIRKKMTHLLDKELPLLSKSFPDAGLTKFSKANNGQKEEADLTGFGKNPTIANSPKNKPGHEKITSLKNNKLYNCKENILQKRVRSVVRISRRSSEPQTVGSKPIGPVTIMALEWVLPI